MLAEYRNTALRAERRKQYALSQTYVFDQYAHDGAGYKVTATDRAQAFARYNEIGTRLGVVKPPETPAAIDTELASLEQQLEAAVVDQKDNAPKKPANSAAPSSKMHLMQFIAASGGLLRSEAQAQGVDPASMSLKVGRNGKPVFRVKRSDSKPLLAREYGAMAALLSEAGWRTNTGEEIDVNALVDLLDQGLADENVEIYTLDGLDDQSARDGYENQIDLLQQQIDEINAGVEPNTPPDVKIVQPQDTPWGPKGKSTVRHNSTLVDVVENTENLTMSKVINPLLDELTKKLNRAKKQKEEGQVRYYSFQIYLLKTVQKKLKAGATDVPIILISPKTPTTPKLLKLLKGTFGAYTNDGVEAIYVKSTQFAESAITEELILHELLHAIWGQSIAEGQQALPANATIEQMEAHAAGIELEQLRTTVEAELRKRGLMAQFGPAVTNVHELISWGMSNQAFQDILTSIMVETPVGKNSQPSRTRWSAFRALIHHMLGSFFGKGKYRDAHTNAMGTLLRLTAVTVGTNAISDTAESTHILNQQMAATAPMTFSTAQIFEALGRLNPGKLGPAYTRHLEKVLSIIVDTVYADGALRAEALRTAPKTAEEVYLISLAEGKLPFSSKLAATLRVTDQEAFVLESAEITIKAALDVSQMVKREAFDLWNEAKRRIQPRDLYEGDWDIASDEAKQLATNAHALIFTATENADGTSDYLSQFMAAGLAYGPLYKALGNIQATGDKRSSSGLKFAEKLKLFFNRIMEMFSRRVTRTWKGQTGQEAVISLAASLARIEVKRQRAETRRKDTPDNLLERMGEGISNRAKKTVGYVSNSSLLTKSRYGVLNLLGTLGDVAANGKSEDLFTVLDRVRDNLTSGRLGWAAELWDEIRDERDTNVVMRSLLAKTGANERSRLLTIGHVTELIKKGFVKELTKGESDAVSALLHLDVSVLIQTNQISLKDLPALLTDRVKLEEEIAKLEAIIRDHRYGVRYIMDSRDLGYHLAGGYTTGDMPLLNAHNIAAQYGTGIADITRAEIAAVSSIIDPLITLYGMRYSSLDKLNTVASVLTRENAREGNANGIKLVLNMHTRFKADALENLFDNDPIQMQKGYTKDITNPYIEVLSANDTEGAKLLQAGYELVTDEAGYQVTDVYDPSGERKLYVIRDRGLQPTASGVISNVARKASGYSVHGNVVNPLTGDVNLLSLSQNTRLIAAKQQAKNRRPLDINYDPRNEPVKSSLVPVFNLEGDPVNFRYLMTDNAKDALLERNNNVADVMGYMAGSYVDKQISPAVNALAVDAMHNQYKEEFLSNQNAYLEFGPNSTDPVIKARYDLLPIETKNHIRDTWGGDTMMVRRDLYKTVFGYRKYSMGEMFEKEAAERNFMEAILVGVLNNLLGEKAALKVIQAENIWQEAVAQIKDIWVIKNLFTFLGNESSNFSVLWLYGVSVKDMIGNKIEAISSTLRYMDQFKERAMLISQIDADYLAGQDLKNAEARVIELNDAINRNPVRELIEDDGLFQTLVEDVGQENDPYSYASRSSKWLDEKTERISPRIKSVGKQLLMTHDTTIYKVLSSATMLSDFTSRYVLFKHLTERKSKPMERNEALSRVRRAFVNYDVATHKGVQYLNDMGLLYFTKYYFRIQNVIIDLAKDNPTRAVTLALLIDPMFNLPTIFDSSVVNGLPGRTGNGALGLFGAIPEIATVKAAASVF
jgi:hypothetical protein